MTAAAQKNRLGRGLASLIGDLDQPGAAEAEGAQSVAIDALKPNPANPRRSFRDAELDELASSIRERGLVQPIVVRPSEAPGQYEIVAGERRWRAAQRAALHKVPVIVRRLTNQEALELAIIENVQRADLNAIEEARGYRQLMDKFGHTQEGLSGVVGKSRSHLANMLRLLKLPDPVLALVEEGRLSAGHARALVGRDDAVELAREIVARGLSVREVEALVQTGGRGGRPPRRKTLSADADVQAAARELAESLGLAVAIRPGSGESGEVRIRYRSIEQFDEIRSRLLSRAEKQ